MKKNLSVVEVSFSMIEMMFPLVSCYMEDLWRSKYFQVTKFSLGIVKAKPLWSVLTNPGNQPVSIQYWHSQPSLFHFYYALFDPEMHRDLYSVTSVIYVCMPLSSYHLPSCFFLLVLKVLITIITVLFDPQQPLNTGTSRGYVHSGDSNACL